MQCGWRIWAAPTAPTSTVGASPRHCSSPSVIVCRSAAPSSRRSEARVTDLPTTPALAWGAATDTGRVRTENEDSFVAEPLVFGVADGMGGHAAGEVASAIAATMLRDRLGAGVHSVDVAIAAVVEANAAIFQGAHSNAAQRGMGTTLTAMVVLAAADGQRRLALLNVGDSRTYVMRAGRLRRVTLDHSYVQELVSTGHITEAEARTHPRRNIVTRA
ncbi:MAG TPA: hypothetical protein DCQ52_10695, partial [Acidimicrobiaceae bacterium]|nr:hypothetical protein [Acidimicrobiaceae bacterium]